jgi:hypothetical protein
VACEGFKIEHLAALSRERFEYSTFRATGSARQNDPAALFWAITQIDQYLTTIRPVTSLKHPHRPPNPSENGSHCIGTLSASPAVHQWSPRPWSILKRLFDMSSNIACDPGRSQTIGFERSPVGMNRSDRYALSIIKHRG